MNSIPAPRAFHSFSGGTEGRWRVERIHRVAGDALPLVARLSVYEQPDPWSLYEPAWTLRGGISNERYVTRDEKIALEAKPAHLARPEATRGALIPIRKSATWWGMTPDERREVMETNSRHIATGLTYLPAIARRLYHCRDLSASEPFDFLTWFEFAPADEWAFDELLAYLRASEEWRYVVREVDVRLTLTEEARRREELPAMAVTLAPLPRELRWRTAESLRTRVLGERPRRRTGWSRLRGKPRRFAALELLLNLEQAPDPDNRVTLDAACDRFGLPKPALHWRWRALDQANLVRLRALVADELERHGLGRVEVADAPPDPNAHHHMGTTRMHDDPRQGVVDADCRVHGTSNVYVAGSSVFTTVGYANPTLTIVALAIRLADHLLAALT